ncbi:class I SAM-dependent methyltransferase [Chitinophaga nivalis]|uniref:Class I SAM-dependent methyltransferase n=1 Tax=Chitinophaga nivalis TaxID=2991709 RepID=A0ABT3IGQ0_9BACT|nr:class I SAM-dependent methyltransferase [Chitinophaga nivalis]MCW3467181.1 class I SAM-dependent methyltransferase [Chitinophaga nivalis]MCW3483127.1 class I SAM-dependent methyltransferase [Chitinophaga nivalis]
MDRDFNMISPSAKVLLLLKGHTNIPFARAAATVSMLPETYTPDFDNDSVDFWKRVVHFELRYWSIDQLLAPLPGKNILELSSGFSFRGLEKAKEAGICYIDTDLPDLLLSKKAVFAALPDHQVQAESHYEILPLNVLDDDQFAAVTARFPPGPLTIVNEGLLMYLDETEKARLCSTIRKVLQQRGGYWITADIYIKEAFKDMPPRSNNWLDQFFADNHIRQNMFENREAAAAFFAEQGFVLDAESTPDLSKIASLPYLLKYASEEQRKKLQNASKAQFTWRLKLAE